MVWDFKLRFTLFSVFMSFLARWMTMFNDEHDGERGLRYALGRIEAKLTYFHMDELFLSQHLG